MTRPTPASQADLDQADRSRNWGCRFRPFDRAVQDRSLTPADIEALIHERQSEEGKPVTEEEAKTRICCGGPFVALAVLANIEGVTVENPQAVSKCKASACMAWRTRHQWLDNAQEDPSHWVSYAPYAFEPGPDQERDDGYCGLAGGPS